MARTALPKRQYLPVLNLIIVSFHAQNICNDRKEQNRHTSIEHYTRQRVKESMWREWYCVESVSRTATSSAVQLIRVPTSNCVWCICIVSMVCWLLYSYRHLCRHHLPFAHRHTTFIHFSTVCSVLKPNRISTSVISPDEVTNNTSKAHDTQHIDNTNTDDNGNSNSSKSSSNNNGYSQNNDNTQPKQQNG